VADDQLDPAFEALLAFLSETRGVDFSGYKRPSLRRLVARRMSAVGAPDVPGYLDLLQVDTAEVHALFDSVLINVTAFLRDPEAWSVLEQALLPDLLAELGPDAPVRAWSAACATGEEAYSLAMVLHRVLGHDDYVRRVKIYATDVDEAALSRARAACYPREALAAVDPELVATCFVADGDRLCFRPDLRSSVIFGRHDLLADAPISRVNLLACRNALMYFTAETQARILERFTFALARPGLLFLGKAEMLLTYADMFVPVSLPHRVFRSTRRASGLRFPGFGLTEQTREVVARRVAEAAFDASPDPQLVLDADQRLLLVNDVAGRLLGVPRDAVGLPFAQLELSYRPAELRSVVASVLAAGEPAELRDVRWAPRDEADSWWDISVAPLPAADTGGVRLTFVDITRYHELTGELGRAHDDLQQAYEELQSSSEELETTNEELQSAIEELETTNEELQSTNEELETMNEELQSSNEELQTLNDELRERTGEIGEVNALLEGILSGLRSAVAVVDRDLRVLVWNAQAERMWGLRAFEVEGRSLSRLDGALPLDELHGAVRRVLRFGSEAASTQVALSNRFGRQVLCTVTGMPLRGQDADGRDPEVRGVILTMDEHVMDGPTA
jgi:two-component system, chemotaxis family, CheB/CheR fusion protein